MAERKKETKTINGVECVKFEGDFFWVEKK